MHATEWITKDQETTIEHKEHIRSIDRNSIKNVTEVCTMHQSNKEFFSFYFLFCAV